MDLVAYAQIENLHQLAICNGIDIPRIRGYRLMEYEEKIPEEKILRAMKQCEITVAMQLCDAIPFWSPYPKWRIINDQTVLIKDFYLVRRKPEDGWVDYIDIRWDRIHGKKRKVLKFEIKKMRRKVRQQYDTWNKYAGQKNILYIYSRMGGHNWKRYEDKVTLMRQPWFLERVDDFWDSTYCDFYALLKGE